MDIWHKTVLLLAAMVVQFAMLLAPALAHRFSVALVLPGPAATSPEGRQISQGFMLATTERDSHANEESDGHLGGLDVYVSILAEQEIVAADIERMANQGAFDIVAVLGSQQTLALFNKYFEGKSTALLVPGQTPFANTGLPAVAGFVTAYETAYGEKPTTQAAQGYNAAQRIEVAVRAQGAADDVAMLLGSFEQTARDFTW